MFSCGGAVFHLKKGGGQTDKRRGRGDTGIEWRGKLWYNNN